MPLNISISTQQVINIADGEGYTIDEAHAKDWLQDTDFIAGVKDAVQTFIEEWSQDRMSEIEEAKEK